MTSGSTGRDRSRRPADRTGRGREMIDRGGDPLEHSSVDLAAPPQPTLAAMSSRVTPLSRQAL
jgi:hypothetical protein